MFSFGDNKGSKKETRSKERGLFLGEQSYTIKTNDYKKPMDTLQELQSAWQPMPQVKAAPFIGHWFSIERSERLLFPQIGTDFLTWCQYGRHTPISKQTLVSYIGMVRRLSEFFGDVNIKKISKNEIAELKQMLIDRNASIGYIRKYLILIKSILRYCIEEREIDVMAPERVKLPAKIRIQVEYLAEDDVKKVWNAIHTDTIVDIRTKALMAILLDSGMRISEALSIDRDTINFTQGKAYIIGKGSKKAAVYFKDSLPWIEGYMKLRSDDNPALFVTHNPGYEMARLTPDDARRIFRRLSKRVGIKFRPHIARRTHATLAWFNGADVKDVQRFLRHSRLQTTEHYLGENEQQIQTAHDKHINFEMLRASEAPEVLPWTKKYPCCVGCGTTERDHSARGLCTTCYVGKRRRGEL